MHRFRPDRELILLLVLSAFALAPLASPGYFFNAHDADHSVFFLVEFDKAIRDGALWPRWGPDHALGYGYPLWLLYAPLAYYAAEFFHLLGLGFTAAVKATWALGFLAGGSGMYLWMRHRLGNDATGRAAALVGGLLYVYAPYHLVTITVRAALAEFSAMAWFPWVLLAFDRLFETRSRRAIALAALAYAGLMLTHTGSILLFTPLLLAYLLFHLIAGAPQQAWRTTSATAGRVAAAGLLAAGLAAIFLLPMLLEQRYVAEEQWVQGSYGYRGHFVYPNQWLDPFWGYGYSDDFTGADDGMSFQLGLAGVILALGATLTGLRRGAARRGGSLFFLPATLLILLAMTPAAAPVWDAVGPAALIQFPWRLLGLAVLGVAVLASTGVASLVSADKVWPAAALFVVLASLPYTVPQYTPIEPIDESAASIVRFETTYPDMIGRTVYTERLFTTTPLVEHYLSGQPLQKAVLLSGNGSVQTLHAGGASVRVEVNTSEPAAVQFYTYEFPGWYATVDGVRTPHRTEPPYGLIAVDVPAGSHQVAIRFGTTPIRTAGVGVSLISVLIVLWLGAKRPSHSYDHFLRTFP